jgi:cytochrome c-type biogenesis protein CcmH/NrfG
MMKINVEDHPTSSNAWDSLGDAYLADGQRDKAREASEKSLKLVGSDSSESPEQKKAIRESAQGKLDQLKAAPTSK